MNLLIKYVPVIMCPVRNESKYIDANSHSITVHIQMRS